ncbi:unnamed protein product, partial [Polarella glacialis]
VKPLTDVGLDIINQTTPPLHHNGTRGLQAYDYGAAPYREESSRSCGSAFNFVPAPMRSYLDHPEDMSTLQRQNDELARNMQELERAKSLAAVTSAQHQQNRSARQGRMRREAELALQKGKEIQADFGSPTQSASPGAFSPSHPTPDGAGGENAAAIAADDPLVVPESGAHERVGRSKAAQALKKGASEELAETVRQAAASGPGGASSTAATLHRPSWSQEASAKAKAKLQPEASHASQARSSRGHSQPGPPTTTKRPTPPEEGEPPG